MVVAADNSFVPYRRPLSPHLRAKINSESREKRAVRKTEGLCINHDDRARVYGCRCFECWLVHKLTKPVAGALLDRAVSRCNGCELRVPEGYGKLVPDVGLFHKRCLEQHRKESEDAHF